MALGDNMKIDKLISAPDKKKKANKPEKEKEVKSTKKKTDKPEKEKKEKEAEKAKKRAEKIAKHAKKKEKRPEKKKREKAEVKKEKSQVSALSTVTPVEIDESIRYLNPIDEQNLKVNFMPSRRKTVKRININIEGELVINNIGLVKERMSDVFENYDHVDFVLSNISQIDLTPVQLFNTLKTIYEPQNKVVTVDSDLSKEDKQLMKKCGLLELITRKKLID